jgi:hypothetical protein
MLQAVQRAELDALLQAAVTPSPSGSLPTPLSTIPSSPGSELCLSHPGVAVIQKHQEPPLHLPHGNGGGDKKRRQANQKQQVEYWRELLAYVDVSYRRKFGRHYPWNNLARKNLWNLARGYSAWEGMALWDMYLASKSWWALQTSWSVYGMVRDTSRLMDDPRLTRLARQHEENLAKQHFGHIVSASDVLSRMGMPPCGFDRDSTTGKVSVCHQC